MISTLLLRFPHIGQAIFKELDNKSLTKCRKISKPWSNFIANQRFYWIRRIQRYKENMKQFRKQWKKVLLNKTTVKNVKAQCSVYECFFNCIENLTNEIQLSPLQIAARIGDLKLFKCIVQKTGDQNTADFMEFHHFIGLPQWAIWLYALTLLKKLKTKILLQTP